MPAPFCFIDDPYTGDTITGAFGMMLVVAKNDTPNYAYLYASCTRTSPSPTHTSDLPVVALGPDPNVVYYTYCLLHHRTHGGTTLHRLSVTMEDPAGGYLDSDTVTNIGIIEPDTFGADIHALKLLDALSQLAKPYPRNELRGGYVLQADNPKDVVWPATDGNFSITVKSVKPKKARPARGTPNHEARDLHVTPPARDTPKWKFTIPSKADAGAEHAAHLRIQVTDNDLPNGSRLKTVTFGLPIIDKAMALFPVAADPPNGHLPMGYFMLKDPMPQKKNGK